MKKIIKIVILVLIVTGIIASWRLGLFQYISLSRIKDLTNYINSFGSFAPLVFILFYIIAAVLFIPGLPLTILAGIVFGPIYGSI